MDAALRGEQAIGVLAPGDEGRGLARPPSPGDASFISTLKPRRSAQRRTSGGASRPSPASRCRRRRRARSRPRRRSRSVQRRAAPPRARSACASTEASLIGELAGHLVVLRGELGELREVADVGLERSESIEPALHPRVPRGDLGRGSLIVPEAGLPISASRLSASSLSAAGSKIVREQLQLAADLGESRGDPLLGKRLGHALRVFGQTVYRVPGFHSETRSKAVSSSQPAGTVALTIQVDAGARTPSDPL